MKIHVVLMHREDNLRLIKAFTDKTEAHSWAEGKFGSEADGIIELGIQVHAVELQ